MSNAADTDADARTDTDVDARTDAVTDNCSGNIIGIDIGGSTTKIIGLHKGRIFSPLLVRASDPIASVHAAFGKFVSTNRLSLSDIDRVMVTGVGASYVTERLMHVPTGKIDEFKAIGKGGLFLSGLQKAIIVSMGTGTAMVKADRNIIEHIGGTGIGGGTLLGLAGRMLNIRDVENLIAAAEGGDLANIDLTVGDITIDEFAGLSRDATASNFGKISDLATKADLAMGIINLVFQTIGIVAIFATRTSSIRDIVLTGSMTKVPQSVGVFRRLERSFDISFHTPLQAEYATAVGAAIACAEGMPFNETV